MIVVERGQSPPSDPYSNKARKKNKLMYMDYLIFNGYMLSVYCPRFYTLSFFFLTKKTYTCYLFNIFLVLFFRPFFIGDKILSRNNANTYFSLGVRNKKLKIVKSIINTIEVEQSGVAKCLILGSPPVA